MKIVQSVGQIFDEGQQDFIEVMRNFTKSVAPAISGANPSYALALLDTEQQNLIDALEMGIRNRATSFHTSAERLSLLNIG